MPRKSKRLVIRRRGKARAFRRRGMQKRNTTTCSVVRFKNPVPPRMIARLKYCSGGLFSDGTNYDHLFRLNSLYDPDQTATGHQPYGRDTYSNLYARYRVFRVSYIIDFTTTSTSTAQYVATVLANNDDTLMTSNTLIAESPGAISKPFTSQRPCRIKGSVYLPKLNGSTATQYKSDDRFQAFNGASPTEVLPLHIFVAGTDGIAPANNAVCRTVTMFFYAEFFDPYQLSQS